jgi:hypothetical protein
MNNQNASLSQNTPDSFQKEDNNSQTNLVSDNPVIQRALRRLKNSQEKENHVSHYTKHGSHSSHSKGIGW